MFIGYSTSWEGDEELNFGQEFSVHIESDKKLESSEPTESTDIETSDSNDKDTKSE